MQKENRREKEHLGDRRESVEGHEIAVCFH